MTKPTTTTTMANILALRLPKGTRVGAPANMCEREKISTSHGMANFINTNIRSHLIVEQQMSIIKNLTNI